MRQNSASMCSKFRNKTNVNDIINTKEENKKILLKNLQLLDNIICLFNELKELIVKYDCDVSQLRMQHQNEGETEINVNWTFPLPGSETIQTPYSSVVSKFNVLSVQLLNDINSILKRKIQNENGLSVNIIKPWAKGYETHSLNLNFKMSDYNWIKCASSCIIDNISILFPAIYKNVYKNIFALTTSIYTITKDGFNYVNDGYLLMRTATLAFTVNFPSAPLQGTRILVKDFDSNSAINNITLNAGFGDTINAGATDVISTNGQSVEYIYSGTNWVKNVIFGGLILLSQNDNLLNLDTTTIGYTLHLPVLPNDGTILVFRDIYGNVGFNVVTLDGNSATIDGLLTKLIDSNNEQYSTRFKNGKWETYAVTFTDFPYVNGDVDVEVHMGSSNLLFPFVTNADLIPTNAQLYQDARIRSKNFDALLCSLVPLFIHKLSAIFEKNIQNVDFSIKHIKHIIEKYDLI